MRVLWISRYHGNLNGYRPEGEILIDLKRAGVDITFMGWGDEAYIERIRQHEIPVIDFKTPENKLQLPAVRQIRQVLKQGQFDVVQAFQGKAIAAMLMAAIGIPVKTVAYRGQTGNIFRYDPSSYLTMLHPRLDAITCVAKAIEVDLRPRLWRKDRPVITTIYKGHDVRWYKKQPVDLTERLGIKPGAFVLGIAANMRPRKGVPVLIEAMKSVPADSAIHLLLMGHGTDGDEVKALAAQTPFADKIHCLGYRKDVIELISSCDATVLPTTKREGLSRSIIESMALEIPVIASDTGGNAELVAHMQTGLVVPPGDAETLANAIVAMYQNQERTRQWGVASRQRIAEQFNHDSAVTQYLAFYQRLAGEINDKQTEQ